MTVLYDVAAMLVLAAALALLILLVLRLIAPGAVRRRDDGPKPTRAARIESWTFAALFILAMVAAGAAQVAYGAPTGERGPVTIEVLEVRECERPPAGLGLSVACDVSGWSVTAADEPRPGGPLRVSGGTAVEAGDRVAEYRLTGWQALLRLSLPESQWRSTADESKPDLRWMSALPVLLAAGYGAARRAVARRTAAAA
ncbi:hypothetical protein GCM10009830_37490 [Glycomyces endophyticus]|uniref:DUF3592 domain-containing protein n=1 Tax=Glycomyces endophyticus TaxID=480996 RepID=A0ABP4TDY5_9ACTN